MVRKPSGDDLGHDLIGVVDALAALEAQGEGERVGDDVPGSGRYGRNRSSADTAVRGLERPGCAESRCSRRHCGAILLPKK